MKRAHGGWRAAGWTALIGVCAACSDASDPMAVLVTEETRGAVEVSFAFPAFPDLAGRAGLAADLREPMDAWTQSWSRGAAGASARTRIYRETLSRLAERLSAEEIGAVTAQVGRAVEAAESVAATDERLPPAVADRIRDARGLRAESERALGAGDRERALLHALQAGDELRAIGPKNVALVLLHRAEAALEDVQGGAVATLRSERDVSRSERLVAGARQAWEEGDYVQAIRRAYYACQLMGVSLSE